MKAILKISLLILSISLVNCKKTNDYYVVELENESVIVRKTDLPDNLELFDELFYLELVNPHAKLRTTALLVADIAYGYESDKLFSPYKIEGLAVKISGIILVEESSYGEKAQINGISFHNITLLSIEADK